MIRSKYFGSTAFIGALLLLVVACTVGSSSADVPGMAPPSGVEKYDMPNGFPATITYCLHGTRLFEAYSQGGYGGTSPAIGLTSRPDDPSCLK